MPSVEPEFYLLVGRAGDAPLDLTEFDRGERAAVVAVLRRACEEYGDNDWPDNLHLADVLTKHLLNYLEEDGGRNG